MGLFIDAAPFNEGTTPSRNFVQFRFKVSKSFVAKSGANISSVLEFLVLIIKAEQKRAYPCSRTLRICIAANDKFLTLLALQLYPLGRAARDISRVFTLADNAFQSKAACGGNNVMG